MSEAAKLSAEPREAATMWKSPTPHELSLARIDDFMASHKCTPTELMTITEFYNGSKRNWALRHLRLMAAIEKIEEMKGRPDILLSWLLVIVSVITLEGCAAYKDCKWTPDGINYTISRDRQTGDLTDYVGVNWQLK